MTSARRLPLVVILLAALAFLAVLIALAAFSLRGTPDESKPQRPPERGAPVIVARAEAARDDVKIEVIGTALASKAATVFAAVAGEVERVGFATGQRVAAGDLCQSWPCSGAAKEVMCGWCAMALHTRCRCA